MGTARKIGVAAVAATLAVATAIPLNAAPLTAPSVPQASSPLILAQSGRGDGDRFERRGGDRFYRGHRGSREYRRGYRRGDDGWWYPLAAFGLGAAIGSMAAQPRATPSGSAHVDWCYSRYRSYRASDNTFQPTNGPRRQCNSPYG